MKIYEFGDSEKPTLMLLPGTKCHWRNNFGHVIPLLESNYNIVCVSYDGFDDTERSEYPTAITEVEKIEQYIQEKFSGRISMAYGSSLGGTFVALMIARRKIHIDNGILGSSDLDQCRKWKAAFNQKLTNPIAYKYLKNGAVPKWVEKMMARWKGETYTAAMLKLMGIGGVDMSFVSEKSCYNQDYYDAITKIPERIEVEGTKVHIFYALKMGKKYEKRYLRYFVNPRIHRQNYEHEELLMCYPEKWIEELNRIQQFDI